MFSVIIYAPTVIMFENICPDLVLNQELSDLRSNALPLSYLGIWIHLVWVYIYIRAENNHGDHRPRRSVWQIKIVKALAWGQKKIIIPTNFCCCHAINSVLLSRLLHLLGFYHCDVILSEIVLINAGLLEWLDYFSQGWSFFPFIWNH